MNLMDLHGPEFLQIYCLFVAIAVISAVLARQLVLAALCKPVEELQVDHYDAAFVSGGEEQVFQTAIAVLDHKGNILMDRTNKTLALRQPTGPSAHPVEKAIGRAMWHKGTEIKLLFDCVSPSLQKLRDKLANDGLVCSTVNASICRVTSSAIAIAPVFYLGLPKIAIGIERSKPVGFLFALICLNVGIAFIFLTKRPLRTPYGDRILARWKKEGSALKTNFLHNARCMSGEDVALAYALFGGAALGALDPFSTIQRALRAKTLTTSCAGGRGCSGGGGCGGGSGGCGGGGCGGGCGGCGGG
jgi:uncharacterized protein (TIGR04222 family)